MCKDEHEQVSQESHSVLSMLDAKHGQSPNISLLFSQHCNQVYFETIIKSIVINNCLISKWFNDAYILTCDTFCRCDSYDMIDWTRISIGELYFAIT